MIAQLDWSWFGAWLQGQGLSTFILAVLAVGFVRAIRWCAPKVDAVVDAHMKFIASVDAAIRAQSEHLSRHTDQMAELDRTLAARAREGLFAISREHVDQVRELKEAIERSRSA